MRKFASNYLSGRVKVKPPSEATSDRYDYLGLDQAEPNLGTSASQYALSFTNSDVDTNANTITFASNHGLTTGDKVVYDGTGAASDVGSLTTGATYYAIRVNDTVIKLATTKGNANTGQIHTLSGAGGTGTHYIGQTTLLTTTPTGSRKLVSLGEDLDLELVNGEYKIKFADGATQSIISETIDASDLQETTNAGNATDIAVSFTNTTDATDIGTGAVSVTGGLSVGKTLYMDDQENITFKGSADAHSDTTITSLFDVNGLNTRTEFRIGYEDISATSSQYSAADGSLSQQKAFSIYQNINHGTGKQISRIYLGSKFTDDTITGSDAIYSTPSESHVYTNPVLVLDPNGVGDNTGLVRINGNLEVLGTQTTINSTTLEVADLDIVVAKNADTSVTTDTAGIIFGNNVGTPTSPAVDYEWNSSNLPPSIKWYHHATHPYLLANKKIAATGFIHQDYIDDNATGLGLLRSDGSIDTSSYSTSDNNTTYVIDTNTATTQQQSQLFLTAVGGSVQTVDISVAGGIGVQTTAATTSGGPGGTATNATITIDGTGVSPVTYDLSFSETNSNPLKYGINLTDSGNTTDTINLLGLNGILITDDRSVPTDAITELTMSLNETVTFQGNSADVTINRTGTTNNIATATELDVANVGLSCHSTTAGIVADFKRDSDSDGTNGGVINVGIVDNADPETANCFISLVNTGTGKDSTSGDRQGEITTKQPETNFDGESTKSGIRIWGHNNIDFDVSDTVTTPSNLTARRLSVTEDGVVLRNYSDIIYDGTNYETYVQFTDPTADRTIVFPDASGTVALLSDLGSNTPGQISTSNDASNEDQYIVFADEATTSAGVTQDPLTNASLRFNPSTSELTVSGDITITGTLSATSKSFLIDHPAKKGKKLQYASLEGPENGVYVRGKLQNENVILLPDYWRELVDEDSITVNITPLGQHQDLFIQSVSSSSIVVGGKDVNCFYTVFAERKDIEKLVVEYEDI